MTWIDNGRRRLHMPSHPRATPQGQIAEHILVVEKALGHSFDGKHPIHHHNEIPDDNRNENLVLCEDHAYHKLLHVRMRVLKASGDPNTQKLCCRCKTLQLKQDFTRESKSSDGLGDRCRTCRRLKQQDWRKRNRPKLQEYARRSQQYRNEWRRKKGKG